MISTPSSLEITRLGSTQNCNSYRGHYRGWTQIVESIWPLSSVSSQLAQFDPTMSILSFYTLTPLTKHSTRFGLRWSVDLPPICQEQLKRNESEAKAKAKAKAEAEAEAVSNKQWWKRNEGHRGAERALATPPEYPVSSCLCMSCDLGDADSC